MNVGPVLRDAVKNGFGKAFDLPFVSVSILAQRAMELAVFDREAFHLARFVKPRQKHMSFYAPVFPINPKALLKIAARGNGQIQMAQGPAAELDFQQPTVRA